MVLISTYPNCATSEPQVVGRVARLIGFERRSVPETHHKFLNLILSFAFSALQLNAHMGPLALSELNHK